MKFLSAGCRALGLQRTKTPSGWANGDGGDHLQDQESPPGAGPNPPKPKFAFRPANKEAASRGAGAGGLAGGRPPLPTGGLGVSLSAKRKFKFRAAITTHPQNLKFVVL